MKRAASNSKYGSFSARSRRGGAGRRSRTTSIEEPIPEQMSEESASDLDVKAGAGHAEQVPALEPADLNESKKETAHGPRFIRVQSRHIIVASPHPVTSQASAPEQMAAFYPSTPSSARVEQGSHLVASVERTNSESSIPIQESRLTNPGDTSPSALTTLAKNSSGHMSDGSSYPSVDDDPEDSSQVPSTTSRAQSPFADPSPVGINRIPTIRVQQPTRDPSESLIDEGMPGLPSETEVCETFGGLPLQSGRAGSDGRMAAPDFPGISTNWPDRAALPLQAATACSPLVFIKPHKSRLLLRKCRNRLAAEPLLNLALGRSVAKVAKPALRLAANPTEVVLAMEEAGSTVRP